VSKEFRKPKFNSKDIEVRYEDGTVDIFATVQGLKKIITICELLIDESPDVLHQHLESHGILTKESLKCDIRLFTEDEIKDF
jgi:hypothetical protein